MTTKTIDPGIKLARGFAQALIDAGMSAPDGCAALALSYAMWIEAQPDGSVELCQAMIDTGRQTAHECFVVLRKLRKAGETLLDEAAQAVQ
jgi:hypothetical protein